MPFLLESNREDFLLFNKFEGKRNNYVCLLYTSDAADE